MKKASIVSSFVFAAFIVFVSVAIAQKAEKGWERTITLPSGEVILDISGEWAVCVEHYGPWERFGTFPGIMEIKQEGISFVGITLIGTPRSPKGSKKLEGKLDETGFKKVQTFTGAGPVDMKGKIRSNGNWIILKEA